jgi:hypothetical protein
MFALALAHAFAIALSYIDRKSEICIRKSQLSKQSREGERNHDESSEVEEGSHETRHEVKPGLVCDLAQLLVALSSPPSQRPQTEKSQALLLCVLEIRFFRYDPSVSALPGCFYAALLRARAPSQTGTTRSSLRSGDSEGRTDSLWRHFAIFISSIVWMAIEKWSAIRERFLSHTCQIVCRSSRI